MPQTNPSAYEVLGVNPQCTQQEIRDAYRGRVSLYHPDRTSLLPAAAKAIARDETVRINLAYEQIGTAAVRAVYDLDNRTNNKRVEPETARSGFGAEQQARGESARGPKSNTAACEVCRRGPVVQVAFRRQVGLVVFRYRYRVTANLCKHCGMSMFRSYMSKTLGLGWWGPLSFFFNFQSIWTNLNSRFALRGLEAPLPELEGDKSRSIWRRPVTYPMLLLLGLFSVGGAYGTPKTTGSAVTPSQYFVGGCIGEEKEGTYPPIACGLSSARYRVTKDSPDSCPGMVLSNSSAKFCVTNITTNLEKRAEPLVPYSVEGFSADETADPGPSQTMISPGTDSATQVASDGSCVFVQVASTMDFEKEAAGWWAKALMLEKTGKTIAYATSEQLPFLTDRAMVVGAVTPNAALARTAVVDAVSVGIPDAFARNFDSGTCAALVSFDALRTSNQSGP